jgi:hypothetical protein
VEGHPLVIESARRRRALLAAAACAGAIVAWSSGARAHVGGSAFILLLPTHLYLLGGAIVVAVSFLLVALAPSRLLARAESLRVRLGAASFPGRRALSTGVSLLSLAVVVALIVAGVRGSRDPLANPLPLFVWTVWWIGFTYLHAAFGNLWAHLNPWSGLYRVLTSAGRLRRWRKIPPLAYPERAGHWPAVAGFAPFAWFELIHPAPSDPAVLAGAVAGYLLTHFAGVFVFGERWLRQAEPFSVFFRMISWLAPLGIRAPTRRAANGAGMREAHLMVPPLKLFEVEAPGLSGAAFVLLVLASVSFDGLSRTFTWLHLLAVNPLVYPGRTALIVPNTLGLLALFAVLCLVYLLAVSFVSRLAEVSAPVSRLGSLFVLSLVPIACGYHFAHYLPVFLVDVQYAVRAASDPFARGWDLLGTRDLHVVTSFLSDPGRVYAIWHTQVALIVGAHVASVFVAHALALRLTGRAAVAARSQLPLVLLMIGYTVLGLWLLSTPAVG